MHISLHLECGLSQISSGPRGTCSYNHEIVDDITGSHKFSCNCASLDITHMKHKHTNKSNGIPSFL